MTRQAIGIVGFRVNREHPPATSISLLGGLYYPPSYDFFVGLSSILEAYRRNCQRVQPYTQYGSFTVREIQSYF